MKVKLAHGEEARAFELKHQGDALTVTFEDGTPHTLERLGRNGARLELLIQGRRVLVYGVPSASHKHLWVNGKNLRYEPLKEGAAHHAPDPRSLAVSIPAVITEVLVKLGDRVGMGDKLVLLESMKMALSIQAPYAGVVKALYGQKGQSVEPGVALVEVEADEPGVQIVEVGPRDGLQNEAKVLSIEDKLRFIELLAHAGLRRIEIASFVHAKRVPQMADARELYQRLPQRKDVRYCALAPNARGMEGALAAGVREVAVFTAASETFNRKNVNMSIGESFAAIAQVIALAKEKHVAVRGYLSTCFGCPYEGRIEAQPVAALAERLLVLGCFEVSVSDTIGVATPGDVDRVLDAVLARVPAEKVALHFHDTRGMALANVARALEYDVAVFDSAAGGAGGCPFAPGAAGNVATEDLLYMFAGMGVETGVSLNQVAEASRFLESVLDRRLPSRVLHSPPWPLGNG